MKVSKKILLTLSLLFSSIFLADDGPFTVFYGFQTEDPLEIVEFIPSLSK